MNPFTLIVPRLWSAEEALATVVLLRQFIQAIWEVHGEHMVAEASAAPDRWPLEVLLDSVDLLPDYDGDLPY